VLAFAIVTCLGTLGFETTSLAAVIGAMGLAIGLALQGNLGNLASGVLLLIFRPFQIGDSVIVAGQTGVIDGIDLFTTNLDTLDNRRIIIPNSAIFGGVIENQSHHPKRSVTVLVATSGMLDLDKSRAILTAMVNRFVSETGRRPRRNYPQRGLERDGLGRHAEVRGDPPRTAREDQTSRGR
jgi:small conductance mechanosensitive channel